MNIFKKSFERSLRKIKRIARGTESCSLSNMHILYMHFQDDLRIVIEFNFNAFFLVQAHGINSVDNSQRTIENLTVCERLPHKLQVFIYDNKLVTGGKQTARISVEEECGSKGIIETKAHNQLQNNTTL